MHLKGASSACLVLSFVLSSAAVAVAQPVTYLAPGEVLPPPTMAMVPANDPRSDHVRTEFPLDGPCGWLPIARPARNEPGRAQRTPAELSEQFRLLERIRDFLGSAPVLSPPIGICPELAVVLVGNGRVAGHAFRVRVRLGLWAAADLSRAAPGAPLIKDNELRWLDIRVNESDLATAGPIGFGDRMADGEGLFFPEPRQTGWFQGLPTYGERLIITRDPTQPLVRPVRLDRALRWFIGDRERELTTTTGTDRTSTERRSRFERQLAQARTQLASLADAEAGAGACLTAPGVSLDAFDGVTRVGEAHCHTALVEDNPALFDRRLSRAAAQVISIGTAGLLQAGRPAATRPASWQKLWAIGHVLFGLDWTRVRRELMPPP